MEREQAEKIAREFHLAYERLAPEFGYATRDASAVPWEDVPNNNRELMIATVIAVGVVEQERLEQAEEAERDAVRAAVEWGDRVKQVEGTLREACGVIEGLADQQAMTDDWYEEPLAKFKAVLVEAEDAA